MVGHRHGQGDGRAHRLGVCRDRAGWVQEEDYGPLRRAASQERALASGSGVGGAATISARDPGLGVVDDERQWASADLGRLHEDMRDARGHGAFTSYNNLKGNADTEWLMRTLKEELLWLRELTTPQELERALAAWVDWCNTRYLHSALGYRTPSQVEQEYRASRSTQSVAA